MTCAFPYFPRSTPYRATHADTPHHALTHPVPPPGVPIILVSRCRTVGICGRNGARPGESGVGTADKYRSAEDLPAAVEPDLVDRRRPALVIGPPVALGLPAMEPDRVGRVSVVRRRHPRGTVGRCRNEARPVGRVSAGHLRVFHPTASRAAMEPDRWVRCRDVPPGPRLARSIGTVGYWPGSQPSSGRRIRRCGSGCWPRGCGCGIRGVGSGRRIVGFNKPVRPTGRTGWMRTRQCP